MKRIILLGSLFLFLSMGVQAEVSQQMPVAVIDDAEMLFDEAPDALDAVTMDDCKNVPTTMTLQQETFLQSCYQTALLCLLGSYLSLKHTYDTAKEYVVNSMPSMWPPATQKK